MRSRFLGSTRLASATRQGPLPAARLVLLALAFSACSNKETLLGTAHGTLEAGTDKGSVTAADASSRPQADAGGSQTEPVAASDYVFDPKEPPPFGTECRSDLDCAGELHCATTESEAMLGGGPAHGYCTYDCRLDDDCIALHPTSICDPVDDICVAGCLPGADNPRKCHGRTDLACAPFVAVEGGSCLPSCGNHSDCDGRFCSLALGVCVDEAPAGLPVGASCNDDAPEDECSGICFGSADGEGVCTGFCRLGTLGCNSISFALEPGDAACLAAPRTTAVGDEGLCLQLCNCDSDCTGDDYKCDPFASEVLRDSLGLAGACISAAGGSEGLLCSSSDAAGDAGDRSDGRALRDGAAQRTPDGGDAREYDSGFGARLD